MWSSRSIIILLLTTIADAARILAILPYPSLSHQMIHHTVTIELAKRGHQMTVFTADPLNQNIPNYTEYSLHHYYQLARKNIAYTDLVEKSAVQFYKLLYNLYMMTSDDILSHSAMGKFLANPTDRFDLLIIASGFDHSLYYLSDVFDTPLVVITSLPGLCQQFYHMQNPILPAVYPEALSSYSDDMNFWQRLYNFYTIAHLIYDLNYITIPKQDVVLRKHFGDNVPSIRELSRRINLMFINSNPVLHYPRPVSPRIIQMAGIRMGSMNRTLPAQLKKLLDGAKQGFIYFSLGSNLRSSKLKPETLQHLIDAFAELPYVVLWKFEGALAGKPKNVFIEKWIPQQGVLCHPNIKLFVYQGGLQSSEEAIDCGVPLLGAPMFSDQFYNLRAFENKGIALSIDWSSFSKDEIKEKIHEMISNPKYKKNIVKLRELILDRPLHPLNETMWWIDYVIRHRGVPYQHPPSLPLYKSELLDIYAFIVTSTLLLLFITWKLLRWIVKRIPWMSKHINKSRKHSKKLKDS